jgi:Ca2+:H+ antiporter
LRQKLSGVVILHLLLIPGTAFITGGARIVEQELHPHLVQLNHSLLTIGFVLFLESMLFLLTRCAVFYSVMALLIPAAFFAALDRGVASTITADAAVGSVVNDAIRGNILQMSRGLAIVLLLV